jgi:hypothetical protein
VQHHEPVNKVRISLYNHYTKLNIHSSTLCQQTAALYILPHKIHAGITPIAPVPYSHSHRQHTLRIRKHSKNKKISIYNQLHTPMLTNIVFQGRPWKENKRT